MAYRLALRAGSSVRGVAAINAPLPRTMTPPTADPAAPLAVYAATSTAGRGRTRLIQELDHMINAGIPVTRRELGPIPRELTSDEVRELARWIDCLDRL